MKVIQLTSSSNWGAIGKIAEQINIEARNRGWETYTAYSRYDVICGSELLKIGSKYDVFLAVLKARFADGAGLGMKRATLKLIDSIEIINPDIIHLHNIHGYVINFPLFFEYIKTKNIPIVWTHHDFWAITGHCSHFFSINCKKWLNGCDKCELIKEYPKSFIDKSNRNYKLKDYYFNLPDNIFHVAVSDWVGNFLKESFIKNKDIVTIPNGVDINTFRPISNRSLESIPDDKFVIMGVASQWRSGKGFKHYMELSKRLKQDEIILMVGLNQKEMGILPDNIIGLPLITSQEQLSRLYNRANVVLSLSSAETFGMTIIESLACGTPVIVFNNTAPTSIVEDGVGFVVKNNDVDDVYNEIRIIKSSGDEKYKEKCRSLALRKYDRRICCESYMKIYEKLIARNSVLNPNNRVFF